MLQEEMPEALKHSIELLALSKNSRSVISNSAMQLDYAIQETSYQINSTHS